MPWNCAWCGKERVSADGADSSYGICNLCTAGRLNLAVESLADLGVEDMDQLPYGLVRLDDQDRVLEYNHRESELSGLGRADVVGRDFFREVAPCTNVRELAGWLHDARALGEPAQTRVRFVFAFASGDQFVNVSLSYEGRGKPAHILVLAVQTDSDDAPTS